jgi:hypothetical protein
MSSNSNSSDINILKIIKEFIAKLRENFPDNINFIIIENIFLVLERVSTIAWLEGLRNILTPFHVNVKERNIEYFQSVEFKNEINKVLKSAIESILGVWIANLIPMEIIFSDNFFNSNVETFNNMSPLQKSMVWFYVDLLFNMIITEESKSSLLQ